MAQLLPEMLQRGTLASCRLYLYLRRPRGGIALRLSLHLKSYPSYCPLQNDCIDWVQSYRKFLLNICCVVLIYTMCPWANRNAFYGNFLETHLEILQYGTFLKMRAHPVEGTQLTTGHRGGRKCCPGVWKCGSYLGRRSLVVSYKSCDTGSHPILSRCRAVLGLKMGVSGSKTCFTFIVFPRIQ